MDAHPSEAEYRECQSGEEEDYLETIKVEFAHCNTVNISRPVRLRSNRADLKTDFGELGSMLRMKVQLQNVMR